MKFTTLALASLLTLNASAAIETTPAAPVVIEVAPVEEVQTITRWTLPGASDTELLILNELQGRGITDRNALATILGNIKQESRFNTNICEGGARVSYWGCTSGGYGLIQWTTASRYDGLGSHAYQLGMNPSYAPAQISYIFEETQWQRIEPQLKKAGYSIDYYMDQAYYWLGWGVHGKRTKYAYDYADSMVQETVPVEVEDERQFA